MRFLILPTLRAGVKIGGDGEVYSVRDVEREEKKMVEERADGKERQWRRGRD